jgi:hypothetical protein
MWQRRAFTRMLVFKCPGSTVSGVHQSVPEYIEQHPGKVSTSFVVGVACGLLGHIAAFAFLPPAAVLASFVVFAGFGFFAYIGDGRDMLDGDAALREIYQQQRPVGLFLKVSVGAPGSKRTSWSSDPHLLSISSGRLELTGPMGTIAAPIGAVQLRYVKRTDKQPFITKVKHIELCHPGGVVLLDPNLDGGVDLSQSSLRTVERFGVALDEIIADQLALSAGQGTAISYPPPVLPPPVLPPPVLPPPQARW